MSTSDAGKLDLRVVGGETATPLHRTARTTRTTTAREQQDEAFGERFKQKTHKDETPTGQQCHPSGSQAHIADRLRREEAAHCGDSKVHTQKPIGPRFTSCLFFRLSRNPSLDKPELNLKKNFDPCLHSLSETQRAETDNSSCQVNGQTPPIDTSIKVASDFPLSERIPFPASDEVETTRDLSITHGFSNGEIGLHQCNGFHILPCGPQPRTGTRSVELEEDIKDYTKLEKHTDLVELSSPTRTMLSSTVVSVLAPHWSGRLRRTKRPEGTGNSGTQGNLQDVTNTASNHRHERFQETADRSLTDGSQAQLRVPFLGTRRNTVGWSTKSGPASLDYESKRKMIQTVSLDVNSGRMDSKRMDACASSPSPTTPSPVSPLSLDPIEQRRNQQTGHQGGLSSLSSKPTTSSLLLSLRRFNSNARNSNGASTLSETHPSPLSSPPSDQDGKLFTTHLSQTFLNNNGQERSTPLISPSSISYRTTETGPIISPSSSHQRERSTFETRFFPASPMNKEVADTPFSQQPQTMNRTQSNPSCSKSAFLSRGPLERQGNCRFSDKSTNVFSESSDSSPRHSPYDRTTLLKTHSLPRRTTLTSTSWWRQVSQEGSSPQSPNDAKNIKEKPNTPLVPPCNDNRDLAYPSPTDNKRLSSQIPNIRDNNGTTESFRKGNMNLIMKTHGGSQNLKQSKAEDSHDHESDRLVKQQYGSSLNNREPTKPHSLPDVVASSKISRATEQTVSHPKDLSRRDVNNSSFTANVVELPPTLLNLKSSNTPTESSSRYSNNHCTSKTNSTPSSSQNKDSQKFTKPPLSHAATNTLNRQALTSKTTPGLPLNTNTKMTTSFHSHPAASQTNIHVSSYTGSSQTPKFTNTANVTPLGFERSYASVHKPVHPKTASCLFPTVNAFSKTNYSPVTSASTSPSFTTGNQPAATFAPSPTLLTPPVTPAIVSSPTITVSSPLTPPATPIITSPNYSDTSSPKEERTFSSSPESNPKKLRPRVEGKRVRRVTWDDSVDQKHSEPITIEKPEHPPAPVSPLSSSRSQQSVKVPSIFSFLRSSSQSNTSPLCSPSPKTSNIQVVKGGKYRSLSSDSADLASRERESSKQRPSDALIFDQGRQDLTTPRQERTLSVESGTVQCNSSAPLSLPPDFSSGYKLRYSSPPYSTLISTRSTQGETKTIIPRSPLFQQSQSNYTPHLPICTDPATATTQPQPRHLHTAKPPLSPISLSQPLSLPFQNKTATQGSTKCVASETDQIKNNQCKNNSQDPQNDQILLVDNRLYKAHNSACVTETLVYSVKSKADTAAAAPKNTTPKPLQPTANTPVSVETKLSQQAHRVQSKDATREPRSQSDQGSSGSSSTESQPPGESSKRRMKESVLGKSRFFSVESSNEQCPKRSRFALKKSVSTPNSNLSRSESERASKTNNKMDQVLNKLRQTFSTRRSEDDTSFPWKWKRASQTPSVSGSSDVSDISVESSKKLEQPQQEKGMVQKDNEKRTESTNRWNQNRYTLIPPLAAGSTTAGHELYIWPDKSTTETDQDEQNAFAEHMDSHNQPHMRIHSPTMHHFDFYNDNGTTNQFLSCRDHSPGRSPNSSVAYSTQFRKSPSGPRSPFSPFSSLSPVSPFTSPDVTDDSVFYSPKLQRRRDSPSPCEPGEGISLGGSRRSRASTGPPSASPGQDKECLASSYADLKYGIEPGRSFSVTSVLSSRPSGPGRISTGSRFMSVGDLSESALTCRGTGKDYDQWSVTPDWTTEYDCQPSKDCRKAFFAGDPGKMRSRSLPRSLTRRLANWSSEVPTSPPVTATTSKPARIWNSNINTCHFAWDTEGPPTPPPTPPLSPVNRRMSQPPSLTSPTSPTSPTFPTSSGAPQQVDSQSSRGHLPSRGYISSLSTFEESSDSSSDTTTDDEYYLETGEDGEKETEL